MITLSANTTKKFKKYFDNHNIYFIDALKTAGAKRLPKLATKTLQEAVELSCRLTTIMIEEYELGNDSTAWVDDIYKVLDGECEDTQTAAWLTLWFDFGAKVYREVLDAHPPYEATHRVITGVIPEGTKKLVTTPKGIRCQLSKLQNPEVVYMFHDVHQGLYSEAGTCRLEDLNEDIVLVADATGKYQPVKIK